jgi:ribulose-phosphate 3-epimerase
VGPENVADLVRAGAEILVAGTSIFHTPDPAESVRAMKQMAGGALVQKA